MRFNLLAPAKLNLFLKIGPRRSDGYHHIYSLLQTITLYDELEIITSSSDDLVSDLPLQLEENLVYKALVKLREKADFPPLRIKLTKNIPVGGGLGGASSDAATVLKGINSFFNLGLSQVDLKNLAESIGSDVPYFLIGGTCLVSGRGEVIQKLPDLPTWPVLLYIPEFSISTSLAYQWWDAHSAQNQLVGEISNLNYTHLRWGENDFEEVISERYPVLKQARQLAREAGVEYAGLSGSGSAFFALSRETKKLENLKKAWRNLPGRIIEAYFESHAQKEILSCPFR